jgi:anionic cell wall polymer biosynthesis LytR-Cps2A-Psr (LCP) family protein
MARLASTVTAITGVPLDGTIAVSFSGLVSVTNAVGGVRMCVDQRVESVHVGVDHNGKFLSPRDGGRSVVYEVGCSNFTGWQALDYLRQRSSLRNGTLDRDKHLREYLKALLDKLLSTGTLTNPVRVGQVVVAAGSAIEVDLAGGRTLSSLVVELREIGTDDIGSLGVPVDVDMDVNAGYAGFRLAPAAAELFAALRADRL